MVGYAKLVFHSIAENFSNIKKLKYKLINFNKYFDV